MLKRSLKLALVQHPMILLIHEDHGEPIVGERVEPWGAPDLSVYSDRVRRNLSALREYSDLYINYEFSGVEMEMLAEAAPDTILTMRELAAEGRLAFVGGDYSQPHGELYSGELNFRQLEYGLKVFQDLVNYTVTCCFHQETCAFDQMPQLLRAFNFTSAVIPDFSCAIIPISAPGPCLIATMCRVKGLNPIAKDSVASWTGLDGAEIPLVIPGPYNKEEYHKGLYRLGHLGIDAPDLREISSEYYSAIRDAGDFVLLDRQALEEVEHYPPTWRARMITHWSYSEGQWAETMYRHIRETESALSTEEAVSSFYAIPFRADSENDWRTLLASMHHDVHWTEVTDLKKTYLERLGAVNARTRDSLAGLMNGHSNTVDKHDDALHVINPLPFSRREVLSIRGMAQPLRVLGSDGTPLPSQCVPSVNHPDLCDLFFLADVPACGAVAYCLTGTGAEVLKGEQSAEVSALGGSTRYTICEDGAISEAMMTNGVNVLSGPGNDLHYLDMEGGIVGGHGRAGRMVSYSGEIGNIVRISAPIGDLPTEIEYIAAEAMPWLEFTLRFHFNNHLIGVMWEDWTKLNAYWPVIGEKIRHDIPFGAIDARSEEPLYAPSWLCLSGMQGGLALLNTGTPKHYVADGAIVNVLAWGRQSYSNRMHVEGWLKQNQYDLSLKGIQEIHSAVCSVNPADSEVTIARNAQCLNTPMPVFGASSSSRLPLPGWSFDLSGTSLISSAIFLRDGRPVCRFYEAGGTTQSIDDLCHALGCEVKVTDLAGVQLDSVTPYRIGYLTLPKFG
jgi:hypothetical protein